MRVLFIVILAIHGIVCGKQLKVIKSWKYLEFDWPSEEMKTESLANGDYIVMSNVPSGISRWKNLLFITIARFNFGVAASLTTIDLDDNNLTPTLNAFPNWEAHDLKALNVNDPTNPTIVSAIRSWVDTCDRLWVLDTGSDDMWYTFKSIAVPSFLIYDLNTKSFLRRYFLPSSSIKETSFFASIVIDMHDDDCENAFAYITDVGSNALIVYSFKENRSWRIVHDYFSFDPFLGIFNLPGGRLHLTDGVFGVALGRRSIDGYRPVFFHPLVSNNEFAVSSRVLQNETYATSFDSFDEYKFVGYRGSKKRSTTSAYDVDSDILFYTNIDQNAVNCWHSRTQLTPYNQGTFAKNKKTLEFPVDLKLDPAGNLWVLSNKLSRGLFRNLNPNCTNFRVHTTNIRTSKPFSCYNYAL